MRWLLLSLAIRKFLSHVSRSPIYDNYLIINYQASSEYFLDTSHLALSASEVCVCSVEPGSAEDVSKIVRHLI